MPVRFSVGLVPEQPISSKDITPDQIHGLFFSMIDRDIAEELHKQSKLKPFCVGVPVIFKSDRVLERIFLRISLLNEDLFPKILSSLILKEKEIFLSGIKLRKIVKPFIDERWIKSYDTIIKEAKPEKTLIFDFKTPTAFKKRDKDFPLPEPKLIFKGLIRKWIIFSGIKIEEDLKYMIENEIEIMGVWIKTQKIAFSKLGKLTGFTGRVVLYINSENEKVLKWINILGKFSEFAGVGRKTTMGFGMVRCTNSAVDSHIQGFI